jgi:penicillin-binding protein 1A
VQFQIPLRVYSADKQLLGEFGEKRRIPVHIEDVPIQFKQALLAAEDNRFESHSGVDFKGLTRATSELITSGRIQSGGSTITMQVAKNFFLSSEKTFSRKFNEILLALKIEQAFSKQEILELYINKIYLGNRAYGIQAAAQIYYAKDLAELSLAELAMLAGLPKAPSKFNPLANPERALSRRNWILGRMSELGYINEEDYSLAIKEPITASKNSIKREFNAPYIAEMARTEAVSLFGTDAYTLGLNVYTTIDSTLQQHAQNAITTGLASYDQRHGYRKPETNLDKIPTKKWPEKLRKREKKTLHRLAIVTRAEEHNLEATLSDGSSLTFLWSDIAHIRPFINTNKRGPKITSTDQLWQRGDIIEIARVDQNNWTVVQTPEAQAALVSLSPENGAILALVGGQNYYESKFNRASQAKRQPGSNFKPLIYAAAMNAGASAASIINDAPIVFNDKSLESTWRPENDGGTFYGPTRLRTALYRSRNLVSIRLLQQTGINKTIDFISAFGLEAQELPHDLSLSLGSYAMPPLQVASIYAAFANGGYRVEPHLISRITDNNEETIYQANPLTVCRHCDLENTAPKIKQPIEESENLEALFQLAKNTSAPTLPIAPRIMDERIAYIMDSILKDVIRKGTGRRARVLNRKDIAGKTGTTNGPTDAWFSGYTPDIATTTWLGFDRNQTLGRREYGGSAALPIWIDYMKAALANKPERFHPRPEGIVSVLIDPETGKRAAPGQNNAIFELFRIENTPAANINNQQKNSDTGLPEELF